MDIETLKLKALAAAQTKNLRLFDALMRAYLAALAKQQKPKSKTRN